MAYLLQHYPPMKIILKFACAESFDFVFLFCCNNSNEWKNNFFYMFYICLVCLVGSCLLLPWLLHLKALKLIQTTSSIILALWLLRPKCLPYNTNELYRECSLVCMVYFHFGLGWNRYGCLCSLPSVAVVAFVTVLTVCNCICKGWIYL